MVVGGGLWQKKPEKRANHHQAEVPVQGKGESVDGKSSNISIAPTHPADRAVGEGNV